MLSNQEMILSVEEQADLLRLLNTKYASFLNGRSFQLKIFSDAQMVEITLTLSNTSETFFYPVQGRVSFKEWELTKKEAVLFLLDYMDYYFEEFFKDGEGIYLTIDWSKHVFDSVEFYLKGQILNLHMERQAEAFLDKG